MALAAAISPIWWSQAISNEVYGLNLLFVSLIFLFLIQLLKENNIRRNFLLLAYVLGLAFTNHLQTILLFPTVLLLLFFKWRAWKLDFRIFLTAVFLFTLGLSPYLYLPIRSAAGPLADWGGTSDWGNFLRHVTGWQYRVYIFDIPFDQVLENGRAAAATVAAQLKWPFWILLPGLFFVRFPSRKVLLPLFLYPVIILIYNAGYDIPDIDLYYLPVIFNFFLLVGAGAFGWFSILSKLEKGRGLARAGILVWLLFATAYTAVSNWNSSDQSKNRFAQEALENIYRSASGGGLVLTNVWDHYAPWLYNHFVLGRRPGLLMLDVNLTNRSWYLDFLGRAHPE
ncbi:MAG: protein O-mannosyl-transferase family, partial [Limisphaerales bacterium]